MLIKDLFVKDITRSINGVIKADQLDEESIWNELDEYVVTRELDLRLRDFFGAYLKAVDNPKDPNVASTIGVWISGYFGSGKSHFIKILSYLLENRTVNYNDQTRQAVEFFKDKITDATLFGDIKRAVASKTDVVLFNIDSKANSTDGRTAILSAFLRVFHEKQGFSGDYPHIARMERHLQIEGKLDLFHSAYRAATGKEWIDERDVYHFNKDELISSFATALGQSQTSATQWLERAETSFPLTPENFAKWVREYLDSRGPNHRILFLVDEIGQFIGSDTHLMLSLQTITEDLGIACGGRAWVVVTSQENIEAVLGEVKASQANDFSKIQGRFKTRLSLSSANTDEVIQERLLRKNPAAVAVLRSVFAVQGDILKNQLSFKDVGMTFQRIEGDQGFIVNYPFVPYQFQLVQKVFEAIRKHGATGLHLSRGERSMLDAFQLSVQLIAAQPVGALIPLYRFYPSIESFLDTGIKRTIDQARDRNLEDFDIEILRVLFLIRYIDEFKGNLDNLVTLCIDQIDTDRLLLRRRIEESLQLLEKETLVSRNGENYFFLTNEERDITTEIKNVEVSGAEEIKKLGDLIFSGVLKDNNKHRYPANKKDFGFNRYCDAYPIGNILAANDLVVSIISPLSDDYGLYGESRCILESSGEGGKLLIKLPNDERLGRELTLFLKTERYVKRKNDDSLPPITKRILRDKADENRQREDRLLKVVDELLLSADYYVAGQTRTVKAASALTAINEQLTYLIENTFPKLSYLKVLQGSDEACRQQMQSVLRINDIGQLALEMKAGDANAQAVAELRSFVDLSTKSNKTTILNDLVDRFSRRPFGWPEPETVLLTSKLLAVGEISLVMDGATVPVEKAFDPLTKPAKWRTILVFKRKTVDSVVLQRARKQGLEMFDQTGPDSEEGLFNFLRAELVDWQTNLRGFKVLADTDRYPGKDDIQEILKRIVVLLNERNSYEFIERFIAESKDLLQMADDYAELANFYTNQKPVWDKLLTALGEFEPNRSELEKDLQAATALKRLDTLRRSIAPYGQIKDAEAQIQIVREVNSLLVERRRTKALDKVGSYITEVERELERTETMQALGNRSLYPIQSLRKRIESETSLGNLQLFESQASDQADLAIEGIEREIREQEKKAQETKQRNKSRPSYDASPNREATTTTPQGSTTEADTGNTIPPSPVRIRPTRTIQPIDLMTRPYLESEEDVQQFLAALSDSLYAAIQEEARIRIR